MADAHAQIDISNENLQIETLTPLLARAAGIVGAVGLAVMLALALVTQNGEAFYRGYITNFAFFTSIALGGLFFVVLQHVTRAGWSVVVRRFAENLTTAFPVLAVLGLPIALGLLFDFDALHAVYPWSDRALVEGNELLAHKQPYLNAPFFILRMIAYFTAWILLSRFFRNLSIEQDRTGEARLTDRMQAVSAPAMFAFALTLTFFAVDLLMSLDPIWFSTIFGVYYFAGSAIACFAAMILSMNLVQNAGRAPRMISVEHYHDVGKLMFGFVVFWAYIGFSQYMLIWYGNLPEETAWYVIRQQQPWLTISLLLLFGHFMAPFLALISRFPKRRRVLLMAGAVWVLLMHWFDMFWLVLPHAPLAGHGAEGGIHAAPLRPVELIQCIAGLAGIGGICVWRVATCTGRALLVPHRDPRLGESINFENF